MWNRNLTWSLALFSLLTVGACGGGGGGTPAAVEATLSTTQQNFETSALTDSYVNYTWSVPSTNVAPTSGTHYMYSDRFSIPSSPSSGAKPITKVTSNFTSTLALPTMTQHGVERVLKSGVIYASNHDSKGEFSYVGSDVVATTFATDGITPLFATVFDNWSTPIPLTGQIGNATVLKSFLTFTKLTASTVNFDFSQPWLPGSSYVTRKGYRQADVLFVRDWSGTTYNAAVNPWSGTGSTIEALFSHEAFVTAGGITIDGVAYPMSAGTILSIEGARAWVANTERPASATSATDTYVAFLELNGKIYYANFQKAGTRFNTIDGVDGTVVHDYNIRINSTASASMKSAIKF